MRDDKDIGDLIASRQEARRRADTAQAAGTATIGVELMNAFNGTKTDPSDLAVLGHDTSTGFEFCVERGGVTYTVAVTRDLST